jgi:signal transduction histidine kinase
MAWSRQLLEMLTAPAGTVVAPRDRIAARVHAGILLVMALTASATALSTLLPGPGLAAELAKLRALAFGAAGLWVVLYALARTRYFRAAVGVWLVLLPTFILIAVANATVPEVVFSVATSYLLVTISSASLLFSGRAVTLVVAGCGAMALASAWLAGLPLVFGLPVVAFLVTGTVMVLANSAVARESEREAARKALALERETAQRVRAEHQSGRLHEVLERTSELILAFADDLSVLEANRAARELLVLPAEGGRFEPSLTASGRDELRAAMDEARRAGQWTGALTLRVGSTEVSFAAVVLAHEGSEGRPPYFSGILRDESVERRLRHMERMESIGQLAGGVAHDFNNALSAIISSAEALQGAVADSEAREDLELILAAASKSTQLTRKLLTLSRRSSVATQRTVDVQGMLAEVASVLRRTLPEGITVELEPSSERPAVLGDPVELEHVLLNLALNARDAMPRGGRITLRTRLVDVDAAQAARRPPLVAARYLQLDVVDTGEGMTPEVAERVFEPFFTTKLDGKGTGLGLASVYGTVRAHRGAVSVSSAPGKGTTFTVLLPLATSEAPAEARGAELAATLKGVLVIDDDPLVREAMRRALAPWAGVVLEAESGEEGVRTLETRRDDVAAVVLDLVMPGLDGAQTLKRLRALAPDVPVVLASGFTHDVRVPELLKAPRVAFVAKPVRSEDLRAALGRVLNG